MSGVQLVHGLHAVRAVVRYDPAHVIEAWVDPGRRDSRTRRLVQQIDALGVPVHRASGRELDQLVSGQAHQGVAVRYNGTPPRDEDDLTALLDALDHAPLLLVLDQVQDPHNLGACLRTADGAGVDAVIAPRDRAVGLTPTVHKVASGAVQSVPFVQVGNLARSLKALKQRGIWLVGTDDEAGQSLFETDLAGPTAIVMGAEDTGLRRLTREACDFLVRLPMRGEVGSLNVSVATGICLYEALRQRDGA
ncbi:23S rRNA (guanosine(2251)-2'-O)-methyltransferase RlmB [Ectothiorhodospiraceae bacterium WFHF3C12]|nr:23S rRNA (guanosine(2251)-2'-O)-methyltransferase RlmB [Ectothiorhodospiraceae bacterium WFHF3C12]